MFALTMIILIRALLISTIMAPITPTQGPTNVTMQRGALMKGTFGG